MELLQLQYFRAIATYGSMSKAAQALFVSQPTLSVTMTRLEESLGFSLFVRKKGKLTLSAEGRQFLVCVNRILNDLDETVESLRAAAISQEESIRVVSSLNDLLGAVMSRHCDDLHQMRINQKYSDNDCIAQLVEERKADWGIVFGSAHAANVKLSFLHECPRIFVVREGHPLLRYDRLPASELANQSYICNRSRDEKDMLSVLGRKYHFIPQIECECDDVFLEMHILNATDCISTMPAVNFIKVLRMQPDLPIRHLFADFDLPMTQTYVVQRQESELSTYSRRLIGYVYEFLEEETSKIAAFLERGEVVP